MQNLTFLLQMSARPKMSEIQINLYKNFKNNLIYEIHKTLLLQTKNCKINNFINLNKTLLFKNQLSRRLKTEKSTKNPDCLKATVNLAAVETTKHDTEAVSHKTGDASGLESNI